MTARQIPFSPSDGGPIYKETLTPDSFLLVEPWNAISSLAIVIPAIYWALVLIKYPVKQYLFMWYCIPLLILGGTGSTLYHAFRTSSFLLYLDVLPTAILTLSIAVFFWWRYTKSWLIVVGIFLFSFAIRYAGFEILPRHTATNIAYFITGTLIFLPILLYMERKNWLGLKWIVLSVAFLIISLAFREIDKRGLFNLPMGTHFLWHLFSGVGAYYLARFLFILRLNELKVRKINL